jgi:hypothetical protein
MVDLSPDHMGILRHDGCSPFRIPRRRQPRPSPRERDPSSLSKLYFASLGYYLSASFARDADNQSRRPWLPNKPLKLTKPTGMVLENRGYQRLRAFVYHRPPEDGFAA